MMRDVGEKRKNIEDDNMQVIFIVFILFSKNVVAEGCSKVGGKI